MAGRLLTAACVFSGAAAFPQERKPVPVVIIMADQLRADVLGPHTPNINALKKDGVSFSRTYCAAPLCAPSRASFFTGLYPNSTGSLINPWEKEDEAYGMTRAGLPSIYSVMEKEWDSRHVGKQHFFTTDKIDKNPQSLTRWITQADYSAWMSAEKKSRPGGKKFKGDAPELVSGAHTRLRSYSVPEAALYPEGKEYFLDHYIASEGIKAIESRDRSRPLLLNAMFLAPHPPFHIPAPYFTMFSPADLSVPENVGRWYPGQSPLQMYNLTGFIGSRYTREQWIGTWTKYMGLVKLLDDEVGRIIETLKKEGLYDEALIIFTSDHGEMLGSHSLWQKMCMYEESVRVPLVFKMPEGYPVRSREIDTPVSLVDVFPTLMELNALKTGGMTDGRSLLPLIEGKAGRDGTIFIQYDGNGSLGSGQRCLVKGHSKLIVDTFKDEIFLELYELKSDPEETRNLALKRENRARVAELLTELKSEMKRTGDRITFPDDLPDRFLERYGE